MRAPAPQLPPPHQDMPGAGVVTPPRRDADRHGGLRAPGTRLLQKGTRVAPQIFTEARDKDVGPNSRNVPWSPENVLIDTVARLQRDLADMRAESHFLRTPGVPPVVPTPRHAAFTSTKVPRFAGTTSWEQYRQVFDAIVLSNGWDDATAHHYRVFKRGLPHLAFRKDYLACLRVFVSQATALVQCDMASPVPPSSISACHARSSELPRKTRRARRRMRPTHVRDEPVGVESPSLSVQDIPDLMGAIIYDVHRSCQCHFG